MPSDLALADSQGRPGMSPGGSWSLRRIQARTWRGGWFEVRKGNLQRLPIACPDGAVQQSILNAFDHAVRLVAQADQALALGGDSAVSDTALRLRDDAVDAFDAAVFDVYEGGPPERRLTTL